MSIKKIGLSIGMTAALVASLIASAPAASAHDAGEHPTWDFVLAQYSDWNGGWYDYSSHNNDPDFSNNYWDHATSNGSIDNSASSMHNWNCHPAKLFQFAGYSGVTYTAAPGSSDSTFSNNGFDNKASAVKFYAC
ncbi:hypothetical protein [Streptomyces sp. NBC_00286]|uniref:hypothetical protein n=1 Tax=Streptomyces sp. NBC_00286 TaxID=2975701 RepID=UPI002E2C3A6C|nr:hypothetical protein [Streptomyces sp. NBC_00286]